MKQFLPLLFLALGAAASAEAAPDCALKLAQARDQQVAVPDWQAGRRVAGKERLHFHSAPDGACRLRDVFVIPGDSLQALNEYGIYTEVQYVHPRTRRVALGWVESGRLQEALGAR